MGKNKDVRIKTSIVLLISACCTTAFANFRTPSENTELIEDAMSGGAAIAIDASTNFFNPAGLTRINHGQFVSSGKLVRVQTDFVGTSAGTSGNAQSVINAIAPALHYATPIYKNLYFGVSATAPWGSSTEYREGSILQFVTTKSTLITLDLGPSLAYRFNQHFSLGAGPNAQYGRVVANLMFPPPPFPLNAKLKNTASDWGFGWHLGGLYEVNSCTRFGVNYRSQVRHKFKGESTYPGLPASNNVSITLPLPAITTVSAYHAINNFWSIMATIDYTQWDIVRNIVVRNSAVGPVAVIPQNFHNTFRYALGGEYHANDKLIFRSGLSYDLTPMNSTDRNVTLPVADALVWGMGGHYQALSCLGFDAGYLHVFSKRAPINNTFLNVKTIGNADNKINAISMQVTWDI